MKTKQHIGPRPGGVWLRNNRDVAQKVIHMLDRGYRYSRISQRLQEDMKLLRPPARWTIARIAKRWGERLPGGRWRMKDDS